MPRKLVAIIIPALVLGGAAAHAHAFLDHASPRVGSTVHAAPQILDQRVLAHGLVSSEMMVKRPRPITTSAKPPLSWIEKTNIGMRFSRASEIAAASIT